MMTTIKLYEEDIKRIIQEWLDRQPGSKKATEINLELNDSGERGGGFVYAEITIDTGEKRNETALTVDSVNAIP